MATVEDVIGLKNLLLFTAGYQLKRKIKPEDYDIRKITHDRERFLIAIELFNTKGLLLRFRTYIKGINGFQILPYRLYEDPNDDPGPEDELYVNEIDVDDLTFRALVGYFAETIDPDELEYFYYILTEDRDPILTENGEPLVYI